MTHMINWKYMLVTLGKILYQIYISNKMRRKCSLVEIKASKYLRTLTDFR